MFDSLKTKAEEAKKKFNELAASAKVNPENLDDRLEDVLGEAKDKLKGMSNKVRNRLQEGRYDHVL